MKNGPVSGIAGSVRILRLDLQHFTEAEKHGKRQDEISKIRKIREADPLTTTGLDLQSLYEQHTDGVFIPSAKCRVLHMGVQFPTDLVDGADAKHMLLHARRFAQRVFGDRAIFADRVDRDEKGLHFVDLFMAPIDVKKTKLTAKDAVSTTKNLKDLAKKYGFEKLTMRNGGRALQTAFFEYMRDEMQLEGVQRGSPKWTRDPDWKSAEQLRDEELDQSHLAVERERAEVAEAERALAQRHASEAAEIKAIRQRLAAREEDANQASAALAVMEAENARLSGELTKKISSADALATAAAADATRAKAERELAERDRAAASAAIQAANAQIRQIDGDRRRHSEQIDLLSRAAHEDEGLALRLGQHPSSDAGFTMKPRNMTNLELIAYMAPWPPAIAAMARALARALAIIRDATAKVLERELDIANQETHMVTEQAEANRRLEERRAAQMHEHRQAMEALEVRQAAVDAAHAYAVRSRADAEARIGKATMREKTASAEAAFNACWGRALGAIAKTPNVITINEDGVASFDEQIAKTFGEEFAETMASTPPEWAEKGLDREIETAEQRHVLAERYRQASKQVEQLAALLEKAGSVLTPPQQLVADEVRHAVGKAAALSTRQDRGM